MSGVFGVINRKDPSGVNKLLSKMGEVMTHRPWYQVDTWADEEIGVGLGRIGIGIFNRETQPVTSEDGSVVLVMAGEFYYSESLRRTLTSKGINLRDTSDAELALWLYQDLSADFLTKVEGIFVIGILDRVRNQLIVANDRFGLRPTYYARCNDRLLFSPEIKGILADSSFRRKLNLTATAEYMRFQQILGDKTFFEDIYLLPPASVLRLDRETARMTLRTYWDWRSLWSNREEFNIQEVAEEAERLLRRAMKARMGRAQRLGMLLSGGLESRSLLATVDRKHEPIRTITYGHHASRDVRLAHRVAKVAGTQHHFLEFNDGKWVEDVADFHLELVEGGHSWIHAHGMSTLSQVRELIDVNLSGFGGVIPLDALTKPRIVRAPDWEAFYNGMAHIYTQEHTWPGLTEAEARYLYTEPYGKALLGLALDSLRKELRSFDHPDLSLSSLFFNISNHDRRMIYNFIIFNLSHFENRCPFYDYRFVEFVATLPPEMKANRQIHALIIEIAAPRLALIPDDKKDRLPSSNRLVRSTHALYARALRAINSHVGLGRPSLTLYADYENYMRHELRGWAESILFDERTLARGFFRPDALHSLMERHQSGLEEWTIGKIAPIITFELLMRRFFD